MNKFDAMEIFVRVVEKGSFSAVAKERGVAMIELFQHSVHLAADSLVFADTEDLDDFVSGQAKQT